MVNDLRSVAVCKGNGFSVVNEILCNGWKDKRKLNGELIRESCENAEHGHKVIGTTSKGVPILSEAVHTVKKPVKCGRRYENPIGSKCAYCGGDLEFYDSVLQKRE